MVRQHEVCCLWSRFWCPLHLVKSCWSRVGGFLGAVLCSHLCKNLLLEVWNVLSLTVSFNYKCKCHMMFLWVESLFALHTKKPCRKVLHTPEPTGYASHSPKWKKPLLRTHPVLLSLSAPSPVLCTLFHFFAPTANPFLLFFFSTASSPRLLFIYACSWFIVWFSEIHLCLVTGQWEEVIPPTIFSSPC